MKKILAYIKYFLYVCEHKINVIKSYKIVKRLIYGETSTKLKLFWRCIFHDMSKFTKKEFKPYALKWYYDNKDIHIKQMYKDAWVHHYTHNKHHQEFWSGKSMDKIYVLELICDWTAMSMKFNDTPQLYYYKIMRNIYVSRDTRRMIEYYLGFLDTYLYYDYNVTWEEYCIHYLNVSLSEDFEKLFGVKPIV